MNVASALWGSLSGAEKDLWDNHLDELLDHELELEQEFVPEQFELEFEQRTARRPEHATKGELACAQFLLVGVFNFVTALPAGPWVIAGGRCTEALCGPVVYSAGQALWQTKVPHGMIGRVLTTHPL